MDIICVSCIKVNIQNEFGWCIHGVCGLIFHYYHNWLICWHLKLEVMQYCPFPMKDDEKWNYVVYVFLLCYELVKWKWTVCTALIQSCHQMIHWLEFSMLYFNPSKHKFKVCSCSARETQFTCTRSSSRWDGLLCEKFSLVELSIEDSKPMLLFWMMFEMLNVDGVELNSRQLAHSSIFNRGPHAHVDSKTGTYRLCVWFMIVSHEMMQTMCFIYPCITSIDFVWKWFWEVHQNINIKWSWWNWFCLWNDSLPPLRIHEDWPIMQLETYKCSCEQWCTTTICTWSVSFEMFQMGKGSQF